MAGAGAGHPQPGAVACRGPPPLAGADGDRQRQDVHGLQPGLPAHPARGREAGAVPRRPQQPGAADAARVPGLHRARRRAQVHRTVQRPATGAIEQHRSGEQGLYLHHPAGLLHAPGRGTGPGDGGGIRLRRGGCTALAADGGVQPELPHRGVRLHHHRRVPPLHLRPVAAGAGVLRRLPHRPHGHAIQADHGLLQPEPGHGIRPSAGGGGRRQRPLQRLSHRNEDHGGGVDHRGRHEGGPARPSYPHTPVGGTGRGPDLYRPASSTATW